MPTYDRLEDALADAARRPKLVYIAGPYGAKTKHDQELNIVHAKECAIPVARHGGYPVIPHANTAWFDDLQPLDFWYEATAELLRRCDAILLIPHWESSKGAVAEKKLAEALGIPVFHFFKTEPEVHPAERRDLDDLCEWLQGGVPAWQ